MHISAESVTTGWMMPSGTNILPIFIVWFILCKNEVDYGTVVYELCIMEHVMSTQRMVAYGDLWLYINCTTQGQLIIPSWQGRWKWLMAVLVSLQRSVTENPLDTTWNPCHNQFKLKKNKKKSQKCTPFKYANFRNLYLFCM
jgi:hypothetical protein